MNENNLLIEDYKAALYMQYACNANGVVLALAEIMPRLNYTAFALLGKDGEWRDRHPITRLTIHQLSSLCGNGESISDEDYHRCHRFVALVVKGRILPDADYTTYTSDDLLVLNVDAEYIF